MAHSGAPLTRAAIIINPTPTTTLKALAGRAFRAPSAFELYYHDGSETQKPALRLDPERLASLELVAEQQLGRTARLTVSGYRLRFDNGISLVTDPADSLLVYRNVGGVSGRGLEVELTGSIANTVDLRAAYAYQRVTDRLSDAELANSPRHLFRLGAAAPLAATGLTVSGDLRAVGDRWRDPTRQVPGYLLANLSLVRSRVARLDWGVTVFNLFNRSYGDPGGDEHLETSIPQDGRAVRLRLGVRF